MFKEFNVLGQVSNTQQFNQIRINIASPEQVRAWSFGEVTKPETINYRTFKPEKDGLFCARIFGPVKDYECLCGKYKRMKYKGVICEKCGVEITSSRVRRERMGHIELASPVVHIWFLKSLPSRIGALLDITMKNLEKILYFETYIVVDPGLSPLSKGDILSVESYNKAMNLYSGSNLVASTGAEVIKQLLSELDLKSLKTNLSEDILQSNSETRKKKLSKRLKLVEDFLASDNKPEWMIMDVLPVIPPEIRPLVMLDGGRFATSDLNELYRRVINRNNRLKRLLELKAPDIIIKNEKRMLQESVVALFDNGRKGKVVKNSSKRPFKSLSDMLKGKQGRFRQNLLGKRVDYSGRSVIVVGPELKLHQCGLPKKMALELFKPFIYSKLELYGISSTIKNSKKIVDAEKVEVWDILEEVMREHPVLLNRAPTLHRLSIQAFEPILIEGKAIQLHPLVCAAFNADFDGDQMAVHIPLSLESQVESRILMMSTNNILSPANGKPIISADKDIVLGLYYLTLEFDNVDGNTLIFNDIQEVEYALFHNVITLHSKIKCRISLLNINNELIPSIVDTTPGRFILGQLLPKNHYIDFRILNQQMTKKNISNAIDSVYRYCGPKATVIFADQLMQLGFKYASQSGISFGMDDMIVPQSKSKHVDNTIALTKEFERQYSEGLITFGEKYNKVIDAWSICTDKVADDMLHDLGRTHSTESQSQIQQQNVNSIYMMAMSGARGSAAQIKQLSGMRGLMTKPSGEIIETPIISNFKEGLNVREYFHSTHGARKGLTDTALKTANSGYLTRRLVDVAQDCTITIEDCGTEQGIEVKTVIDSGEITVALAEQILGRTLVLDTYHPVTNELLAKSGEVINEEILDKIESSGLDLLKVRSVIFCKTNIGVCAKCYGRDLATGVLVSVGEAIGVIAAQSIGEPGTQLTMRTFHIGGAATKGVDVSSVEANFLAIAKVINANIVKNSQGMNIVMSRSCELVLTDNDSREKARYKLPYGTNLIVQDSDIVHKNQKLAEWDPYNIPIITEKSGIVVFKDMIDGVSFKDFVDDVTGISSKIVIESKQYSRKVDLRPRIQLLDDDGNVVELSNGLEVKHYLSINTILSVLDGDKVLAGDILGRIPRESSKTRDITGGLPRVAELVEARFPKDHAVISDIDGYVSFGKDYKSKRRIIITSDTTEDSLEYVINKGKHLIVTEGDFVKKGDTIVDGNPVLQDILKVMGVEALSQYMIQEIQSVYRLQGVKIDNKHIEVIIRQMLRKVRVTDSGDTNIVVGEVIDKQQLLEINNATIKAGNTPASYELVLQGITKASLETNSFISAASFQETTKVLTQAAVSGKVDKLLGLKENVIVGRLIPAGTGFYMNSIYKEAHKRETK
ncbi:DNA-directed RNA polymerase subunit beta' [Rickettsia endosymbiont of Cardiosporidium cionae]|uniref:DNA-directed RNA polymerase subunit beta' n=1 Tax=Rickettsia endosymbiont of Cardiosporidium cionae TaxID=2777155 RepID=UPI001893C448|nr:DNA-directed RNA polymerase subunit beta' [Rickettsia endosymbiont of Cardiosporidium cionae]KAF8818632.1 DNA-directed RNA polymerase subunit beta' [Rickettsia endosymbiont of Cardiosporidium cionae]